MSAAPNTPVNTMKWLLKREFWEHKGGFFWTPIVISAVIALITAVTVVLGVTHTGSSTITINPVTAWEATNAVGAANCWFQSEILAANVAGSFQGDRCPTVELTRRETTTLRTSCR